MLQFDIPERNFSWSRLKLCAIELYLTEAYWEASTTYDRVLAKIVNCLKSLAIFTKSCSIIDVWQYSEISLYLCLKITLSDIWHIPMILIQPYLGHFFRSFFMDLIAKILSFKFWVLILNWAFKSIQKIELDKK